MASIQVLAPLAGWCTSLEEVPDPVFAGRMLGDGLAIDPIAGLLVAPCAGEIMTLPATAHAVSIRTLNGIDLLLHIGIDTVAMQGRGFESLARPGNLVQPGEPLIRFDLDVVARGSKSLLTPIVVTSIEGVSITRRHVTGVIAVGDPLFELATVDLVSTRAPIAYHAACHRLTVSSPHGLHARPAAMLVQRAKQFQADIRLTAHARASSARSVVGIMALGVRHGDELIIEATGEDADQAIASLIAGIEDLHRTELRTVPCAATVAAPLHAKSPSEEKSPAGAGELSGSIAVTGFAVGRAAHIERRTVEVEETGSGEGHEKSELQRALGEVRLRLRRIANAGDATRREIIEAHLEFIDDPSLMEAALASIAAGKSAGFAWRGAIGTSIQALQRLDDSRLRERVDDLLDVEAHVLLALTGEARPMIIPLPEEAILIAEDVLPSELASLDRQRLVGICLSSGGATSHVAILAAAMGIPMLVGLGEGLRDVETGALLVVDAERGILQTGPTAAVIEQARLRVAARGLAGIALRQASQSECRALDGTRIEIFANVGNVADAIAAAENGAEGCGLLRTEFLFLDREDAPSENEQLAAYQAIADALGERPMILRLMDVGGDKPLRYLPLPAEDNPALGLRGVRTALTRPDLMRTQLRAALRVTPVGKVRLLIPMITDVVEVLAVRSIIDQLQTELQRNLPIELGGMIETPASALNAARLLRDLDFLSIGSNDLTQYTLAMDRGHSQLAPRTDALHPAVLKLIAMAAAAGVAADKLVAVCGGVAADPLAVPLLLGLGVRELSVVPGAIPAIKHQIRQLRMRDCRALSTQSLELDATCDVRQMVKRWLDETGIAQ